MTMTTDDIAPAPRCNFCGGSAFRDARQSANSICTACGSTERVRVAKLFLDRHGLPRPGMRIAHFAPEKCLGQYLQGIAGAGYEAYDIDPSRYDFIETRAFDLCRDVFGLPSDHYDLIVHNHVIEHLPCNYTMALLHLHRALKPDGRHLFSVPIHAGAYEEDLAELPPPQRRQRFRQGDHIRRFGRDTVEMTLGMIFRLPQPYRLDQQFSRAELAAANVHNGLAAHHSCSVMCLGKDAARI